MELKLQQKLHGFTVQRVRESAELGGVFTEFTHDSTGARVCWLNTGNKNKLFSIAFKTTPEDDTGVFHIIEHSTLCGSERYPVREPFVELLKGSMNTFLNAFTSVDWTMYPVSSRNDKDFMNLCNVYLDAVFAPRILTFPNIFYQEGWHIEQNEGKLSYKGVVFNEMKGATADVDDLTGQTMLGMLFPDSCYRFNSGGDPKAIPQLTYEKFVETYRRYYHPSNARVYLDGALDIDAVLELMDGYFSRREKGETDHPIAYQQPQCLRQTVYYEFDPEEDMQDKGRLVLFKIIADWNDYVKLMAISMLNDVLCGTDASPLRKAVLDSGLARSVSMSADDSVQQPFFGIKFADVKDGCADELIKLVQTTAARLAAEGLDHDLLESAINHMEYQIREMPEPQGLRRCMYAVGPLMYGGDPLGALEQDAKLAELRAMIDNGGFEALLKELLLTDGTLNVLELLPSRTLADEKRADEEARLAQIASGWTEADYAANAELNKALQAWQATPDTPEQLATIPALSLSDINPEPDIMETVEYDCGGAKVLYHPAECHGITHMQLYFDITGLQGEELAQIHELVSRLGTLPTKKRDMLELQRYKQKYIGRLSFKLAAISRYDCLDKASLYLVVDCSVLEQNIDRAYDLIYEILTETDFSCTDIIKNMWQQAEIALRQIGITDGHMLAMGAAQAHYSAGSALNETLAGITHIRNLKRFVRDFDAVIPCAIEATQRALASAVCRKRLLFSLAAERYTAPEAFVQRLPLGDDAPAPVPCVTQAPMHGGCAVPAQVGFAAQVWNLKLAGARPDGAFNVAANLLSYSYLWNRVRVQGGAYGASFSAGMSGLISTYSYRDPTPAASLDVNKGLGESLREFVRSGEPVDKYVISSVNDLEPLIGPREMAAATNINWLHGVTREDLMQMRSEMLNTNGEALLRLAELLDKFAAEGATFIVGSEAQLSAAGELERMDM